MGNNNRFLSAQECENTCQHKAKLKASEKICSMSVYSHENDKENCTKGKSHFIPDLISNKVFF